LLMCFFIGSVLCGWLIWLLLKETWISFVISAVFFLVGFGLSFVAKSRIEKTVEKQVSVTFEGRKERIDNPETPNFPLLAELSDLTNCLRLMGQKPLKLVAKRVYEQFNESEWDVSKWSFKLSEGTIIDRKLLSNPEDSFQLSVANENSEQEPHVHRRVFDIYASNSKMEIAYITNGRKESTQISGGVLIVPPNVPHQVKLHGLTFVFQAGIKGGKVNNDKELLMWEEVPLRSGMT